MSYLQWALALTPSGVDARTRDYEIYGPDFCLPRTRSFARDDEQLVSLPDPRAYRALSRSGLLLVAAGLSARAALARYLESDPFSVGVYCAIEQGPNDYAAAKAMRAVSGHDFAVRYKALRSAKHYFKQLPSVPGAELTIMLGVMGPLYTFTHSTCGGLHALDQAQADLDAGRVAAALVGAAFSLDDPLLAMRTRRRLPPETILSEGAAVLVLTADARRRPRPERGDPESVSYGIATEIVALTTRSRDAHSDFERRTVVVPG